MLTSSSSLVRCLRIRWWGSLCFCLIAVITVADETPFITGLSSAERAAIGLDDLTPEQRIALERSVERYVAGRSAALAAEAATEVRTEMGEEIIQQEQKRVEAEMALARAQAELLSEQKKTEMALAAAQAELAVKEQEVAAKEQEIAAAKANESSLLERAKVLLTPGTKIEFATVNSTLADEFKGWNVGTLFRLENGQTWRVSSGKYWSPLEPAGKAVSIEPGSFGSFYMRLEGMKPTPKVELVSRN